MKALRLLRAGFGVAALLVAIVAGVSIRNHVVSAETHALQEAQSVTKVIDEALATAAQKWAATPRQRSPRSIATPEPDAPVIPSA